MFANAFSGFLGDPVAAPDVPVQNAVPAPEGGQPADAAESADDGNVIETVPSDDAQAPAPVPQPDDAD